MKLYFKNSQDKERLIAECESFSEAHEWINAFLDEHNFKCYYMRSWEQDGRIKIDVGSWSEFFFIDGITYKEYSEFLHGVNNDILK